MSNFIAELTYQESEVSFDEQYEPWISQKVLARILDVPIQNVNKLLKEAYERGELNPEATINPRLIVQMEGKRQVEREINLYNLDAILFVGFRSKSTERAISFRAWVTNIVRGHIREIMERNAQLQSENENLEDALEQSEKAARADDHWAIYNKREAMREMALERHGQIIEDWKD